MQNEICCPVCGSVEFENLILLKDYPVSNLALSDNEEEAKKQKVYNMNIVMCTNCTHIYNNIPINLEYKQENLTYFTTDIQKQYLQNLVNDLVKKYNIKNKNILEIGCGDGIFLKELVKYNNKCIGYEPSYKKEIIENNLQIINDYFKPAEDIVKGIDYIVIRHVLEHFENPNKFLKSIIDIVFKSNKNIKFIFEVPNIEPTLNDFRVNDFIHEHISYFSNYSLKYLINLLHLNIIELYNTDKNENIVVVCELDKDYCSKKDSIKVISNGFSASIEKLQSDYKKIVKDNQKICIWGAEGRGGGFIKMIREYLKGDELIIDSDKKKFNKYIPSSALKIIDYKELIDKNIDVIIITTMLGKDNILSEMKQNNISAKNIYVISNKGLKQI
jgi:ubiquinone/menaquinone biosynthesis C-methylase UbiE